MLPKSRAEFWKAKLLANAERDRQAIQYLNEEGWRTLVVWECELRKSEGALENLLKQLRDLSFSA